MARLRPLSTREASYIHLEIGEWKEVLHCSFKTSDWEQRRTLLCPWYQADQKSLLVEDTWLQGLAKEHHGVALKQKHKRSW